MAKNNVEILKVKINCYINIYSKPLLSFDLDIESDQNFWFLIQLVATRLRRGSIQTILTNFCFVEQSSINKF